MKEHKVKIRLRLRLILNGKNNIQPINTWAVALLRYGAAIINWKVDVLKKNGQNEEKDLDDVWGPSSKE